MKKLFLFSILIIIFAGCASSLKQLQRGDYDAAIQTAVKQLRVDPTDQEQIEVLDRAYLLANQQDYDRIDPEHPKNVRGFIVYSTNEIYVPYSANKDKNGNYLPDFCVLGHEVWHLKELGGRWHD